MPPQTAAQQELDPRGAVSLEAAPRPWTFATRVAFRFVCISLPLFMLEFPLGLFNGGLEVRAFGPVSFVNKCAFWSVNHIFGVSQFRTDIGDDLVELARFAMMTAVAVLATIVWSMLDRRRDEYRTLNQWLRLLVRVGLAYALLGYGSYKIIPMQMPSLATVRPQILLTPVGFLPRQQMLWAFMGASPGYEMLTGIAEMIAGVLLLIPQAATLGACIASAVMMNVFLFNVFYDVNLKFYSLLLLLMAIFLLLPDVRRLANFFLLNRTAEPAQTPPLFRRRHLIQTVVAAQIILGLIVAGYKISNVYVSYGRRAQYPSALPFWGIWQVEGFTLDGTDRPPLTSDSLRWNRLVFAFPGAAFVQRTDGPVYQATLKSDPAKHEMHFQFTQTPPVSFYSPADYAAMSGPQWKADFIFENPSPDVIVMRGTYNGHPAIVNLRRDKTHFLLTEPVQWVRR